MSHAVHAWGGLVTTTNSSVSNEVLLKLESNIQLLEFGVFLVISINSFMHLHEHLIWSWLSCAGLSHALGLWALGELSSAVWSVFFWCFSELYLDAVDSKSVSQFAWLEPMLLHSTDTWSNSVKSQALVPVLPSSGAAWQVASSQCP